MEYGSGEGEIAPLTPGVVLTNPKWIHHANVGYVLTQATELELQNETGVVGDWHAFVRGYYPPGENEVRDIVCLTIPHGPNPADATYAYTILPGQSSEFVRQYATKPSLRILANTPDVQAVRNDILGLSGAVFWQAGEVALGSELALSVSKPCMILVDESGGEFEISVSSYYCGPVDLHLDFISGKKETSASNCRPWQRLVHLS